MENSGEIQSSNGELLTLHGQWPGGDPLLEPLAEYLGSEICVEALRLVGVQRIFGIPGVQNLGLYSALSNRVCADGSSRSGAKPAVHLIGNEEASAFLAWGAWHQNAELSCLCLIGGPGVTHALSGIASASRDGTPMIVLTSGVRRGPERFQLHDVDNLAILRPFCKALFRPANVSDIASAVAQAVCAAFDGTPGPVAIEIACDLYMQGDPFQWQPDRSPPIMERVVRHTPQTIVQESSLASHRDPLVDVLQSLLKRIAGVGIECTVVADPGRCTAAAAEARNSGCIRHFLPLGHTEASEDLHSAHVGCAVPAAIGAGLAQAKHGSLSANSCIVVALVESSGLMAQGLELSFAVGLPLVVIVVPPLFRLPADDCKHSLSSMAEGMGLKYSCISHCDDFTTELDNNLVGVSLGHSLILEVSSKAAPTQSASLPNKLQQQTSGVDALVAGLRHANVRLVFAAPQTNALQCLAEGVAKTNSTGQDHVDVVHLTDAQSLGFAADAAARSFLGEGMTTAACLIDASDPFALTALSGVGEAFQDRVPLLLLVLTEDAAHSDGADLGWLTQEQLGPLHELCKCHFALSDDLSSWQTTLKEAATIAATAPAGPVSVLLPFSLFVEHDASWCKGQFLPQRPTGSMPSLPPALKAAPCQTITMTDTSDDRVRRAVDLLLSAQRPWIHVGLGAAKASSMVRKLAEMLEAPVTSTISGKGVLPEDHPLWLWTGVGPAMPPVLRKVAQKCDAVLVLGAQLSEIASCQGQWPPRGMKVIQVDADPHVLGANFVPDVAILGDTSEIACKLIALLEARGISTPRRCENGSLHDGSLRLELRSAHEQLSAQMCGEAALPPPGRCSPFSVYKSLQLALPPDSTVYVADSGNTTMLSAEHLRLGTPRHLLAPTDFSSMGYGVPAAVGAALAARSKGVPAVVAATVGDGAFLMTGLELLTAQRHNLPVICVVMRDGELGMISGLQRARGDEEYCTVVPHGLDTLCVAEFLGIKSRRITDDGEALDAFKWAYNLVSNGQGPVLIEAMVSYCVPSFYARGVAAHDSPQLRDQLPTESLSLVRLPTPKGERDGEVRAWASTELAKRHQSGEWDLHWCLEQAMLQRGNASGTLRQLSAFNDDIQTFTYNELGRFARGLGEALRTAGVRPGERVGILMPNVVEHMIAQYAIIGPQLRGIAVNLNLRFTAPELEDLLSDCSPAAVIAHSSSASLLTDCFQGQKSFKSIAMFWAGGNPWSTSLQSFDFWRAIQSELDQGIEHKEERSDLQMHDNRTGDLQSRTCQMYYTSGSTGQPKAVQLSHEIVLCHALSCVSEHRFSEKDVWLHVAPMYHLVDAFAMFSITAMGGSHVFLPGQFNPEKFLRVLEMHKVTSTNLATSMVSLVLAAPSAASADGRNPSLRLVSCGGAPLSRESTLRAQRFFGCEFFQSYGMTECCGKISMSMLRQDQRELPLADQLDMLCSSGCPFEAIQVRVVDVASGEPVPKDSKAIGEVQVYGPTVFKGYLPPSSKVGDDVVKGDDFTADGWFRTGDLAVICNNGYLQIVDRLKDMIIVGSENVYSVEVERVLASHPAVALCCVYGVAAPEAVGEMVKAAVQLREGASLPSAEDLQRFCRKRLADYKVPRLFLFRNTLPLTGTGKVAKRELKKLDSLAQLEESTSESPSRQVSPISDSPRRQVSQTSDGPRRARSTDTVTSAAPAIQRDSIMHHRYSISWHEAPISRTDVHTMGNSEPGVDKGAWIIVSAAKTSKARGAVSPLIASLTKQLQQHGDGAIHVSYQIGKPLTFPGLEAGSRCRGIVAIMPQEGAPSKPMSAICESACERTYDGLRMLQAIGMSELAHTSDVIVAAYLNSSSSPTKERPVAADPAVSACWAFARSASIEMDVPWRLVQVCSSADAESAAAVLLDEARAAMSDVTHGVARGGTMPTVPWHSTSTVGSDDAVWRQGKRWVPRLERLQNIPEIEPYTFLASDSPTQSCIVSGGTGALGSYLINFLSASERLHDIVAVGRRPVSGATSQETPESKCNIRMFSADVANPSDCSNLMKHVMSNFAPCHLVFHLAGVLPSNGQVPTVRRLQWSDCAPILRPKVDGSLQLVAAGDAELPNDWSFVCFSSIFAALGYPRLAPYAAANGFQDGLAECRTALGHKTLSLAWGAWADAGMAHRAGSGFQAFWRSQGMDFVPLLDGMRALGCILGTDLPLPHVCIFPMAEHDKWPAPLFRHPLARRLTEDVAWASNKSLETVEAADLFEEEDIRDIVLTTLASLLGVDIEKVPIDESFATYGLTSMMSIDLSTRLGKALGLELPATLAFDLVNVRQLCAALRERLQPLLPEVKNEPTNTGVANIPGGFIPVDRNPMMGAQIDGVGCALPGGEKGVVGDWSQLWNLLLEGRDCVTEAPLDRPVAVPLRENLSSLESGFSQAGYLDADSLQMFDAASFGISVAEAKMMDPQQRLCLRIAREALEDGGGVSGVAAPVGVFVGVTTVDFVSLIKSRSNSAPPSAYTGTGLTNAVCANRISYAFDLRGPSLSLDTACSSSIMTTDLAWTALRLGRCKGALSLGVNVQVDPFWTAAFACAEMLSRSGRCRFGDQAADGYVRGEGCAGLMLRAVDSGSATNAHPYAEVTSIAVNQDGRSNGLTAPNPASQLSLLREAWQDLAASATSYLEAHGTGTFLGDPIEISTMGRALRSSNSSDLPRLRTTSLKTNIGHLECAAGIVSTLKLALVLQQATVPASLHFHVANPHIDWESCGVAVVSEAERLCPSHERRFGGVSGFGFGGTNGHIVLQTQEQQSHQTVPRKGVDSLRAIVFSDYSVASLRESLRRTHLWIDSKMALKGKAPAMDTCSIAQAAADRVAAMTSVGRARAAVVASSLPELQEQLAKLIQSLSIKEPKLPSALPPRVAFVLVGPTQPRALSAFHSLQRISAKLPSCHGLSQALQQLQFDEKNCDSATFAVLYATATALQVDLGLGLSAIVGHGFAGEAAALASSGVLSCENALALVLGADLSSEVYAWPPAVPVLSSYTAGQMSSPPSGAHWKALADAKLAGPCQTQLLDAALASDCDIIVEICLGEPLLDKLLNLKTGSNSKTELATPTPEVVAAHLGPHEDGRALNPDFAAKSLVGAAASVFALGGDADLTKFSCSSHKARLPPRGTAPVACWPDGLLGAVGQEDDIAAIVPEDATDPYEEIRRLQAQVAALTAKLASKEDYIQRLEQSKARDVKGQSPAGQLEGQLEEHNCIAQEMDLPHFQDIVTQAVCAVMTDISPDDLDIDADLIEEGLDSLSAIELSRRLSSALPNECQVPVSRLLRQPTARAMSALLEDLSRNSLQSSDGAAAAPSSIPFAATTLDCRQDDSAKLPTSPDVFPASALQCGILFHHLSSQDAGAFLETICLEVDGPFDTAAFSRAWKRIIARVPQFRACFDAATAADTLPKQSVIDIGKCSDIDVVSVHDMKGQSASDVRAFIFQDRARGLPLDASPLLRVSVLSLGDTSSTVVVTIHHLIIDGWSWRVVMDVLQQEYAVAVNNQDMEIGGMPALPSFSAVVHHERYADSTLAKQYWCSVLQDSAGFWQSQCSMEADHNDENVLRRSLTLGVEEVVALRAFAGKCGCTFAALFHAVWCLVSTSTNVWRRDVAFFGCTSNRRSLPVPDIEHIVGPVVNTVPLLLPIDGRANITDFVRCVHQRLLLNSEHDWLPLATIQEAVGQRLTLNVIVDVQQDDGYSRALGPDTVMRHVELIDCVGTPLSVRFLLRQDGTVTCTAVSETSQLDSGCVDAVLRGIHHAVSQFRELSTVEGTVDDFRSRIASAIGQDLSRPAEPMELSPPELPLFAVGSPHNVLHWQGEFPCGEQSLENAFCAFASAISHRSNGPDQFCIWAADAEACDYGWAGATVKRSISVAENVRQLEMGRVRCNASTPVAAFSYGRERSMVKVCRSEAKLFCFQAAGSSAAQFAALSQELRQAGLDVVVLELPGHGARRSEAALTDMEMIVQLVVSEHGSAMAAAHVAGGCMMLGVSFGALVAFEVARVMAQQGSPPCHLLVASQAAPTGELIEIDLNLDDAALAHELGARGWLESGVAQNQDAWQEFLPLLRLDLRIEKSYLAKVQCCDFTSQPLDCSLTVFGGSEDATLMEHSESALSPWRDFSTGPCTQQTVLEVGHGFVDFIAGRAAIIKALTQDQPGFRHVALHMSVESNRWILRGDSGLVPEMVLAGIADSFAKVAFELHAGGARILRDVLPCDWRAEPFSKPRETGGQLLQDAFVNRRGEGGRAAIISIHDAGVRQSLTYTDTVEMAAAVGVQLMASGVRVNDRVSRREDSGCTAIISIDDAGVRRSLTYADVAEMAAAVGVQLMASGVRVNGRVALVSSKGWPQLVGAIGILLSGSAYLPIDPVQVPRERVEMLMRISSVSALVVDEQVIARFDWVLGIGLPVVTSGSRQRPTEMELAALARARVESVPEASAYILYTSGSTGVPKGVDCHHRGAINTCQDLIERFSISSDDVALALSSFSFDLSVYDLFGTAIAGGVVVVPPPETISRPDPAAWLEIMRQEGITLINAVPAFLELLVGHCEATDTKLPVSLRLVWMSGDWVPLALPKRIQEAAEGQVTVAVLGGATEAAIWSNIYIVPDQLLEGWKSIPYGRPLRNQTMYVLDERSSALESTAPWVTGMIYIGGVGVALGYLDDEEKTCASFILHPTTGERIYRTGDLGRLRPAESQEDLLIEILGREDSQVKLNGFRIELGEIEAAVIGYNAIEESCAAVIQSGSGQVLAAFFRGMGVDTEDLREHLSRMLPAQLVPKAILRVDGRFPLNSNGKIDRKKLAEIHADALANVAGTSESCVAPRGAMELSLVDAVAEVLSARATDLCAETNLFSLGLNSLGSMRLVAAALSRGVRLSVRDIFTHPTIRALASVAEAFTKETSLSQEVELARVFQIEEAANEETTPFPLIGITKAYWTGLWSNPYCPAGCRPQIAFEFKWEDIGRIDVARLEWCFDQFIQRNAAFRAVVMRDSPSMRYLKQDEVTPIKFAVHEVESDGDIDTQCDQAYGDIFDHVIDPCSFPLLQGAVVHLPNGQGSRFYYCVSLFVMDGITDLTWRLHISKLYRGETLPDPPTLTYKAYNEGYISELTGIRMSHKWQAARDFWLEKIDAGLPLPPQLPLNKESSANTGTFSDRGTATLGASQLQRLKSAAARLGVTPTAALLMIYCVSLARYAGSGRMLINVLHCLRHPVHDDSEAVLGNFSSSFLCPVDVSCCDGQRSFAELAHAVMDALVECQMNNTISGVEVMSLINAQQSALGKAAAPYVFVSALGLEDSLPTWRSLCFRESRVVESTSGTYMVHGIKEYPDGSMLSGFNVVDGAFAPETVNALVQDHRKLLEFLSMEGHGDEAWNLNPRDVFDPLPVPAPLGSLLKPAPMEMLHSSPLKPAPMEMLHSPLAQQADRIPAKIAIIDAGQCTRFTYAEYLRAALAVAQCLADCSAPKCFSRYGAPLVAVACQKGWQQVVAVQGILVSGCAYLPINVAAWPRSRIEAVMDAGEVVAVASSESMLDSLQWLPQLRFPVVNVDQAVRGADQYSSVFTWPGGRIAESIAYCIFTSGSTGKPKGVAMAHDGALNTIRALIDLHQLDETSVVLGLSQLSFDLSVSDIFLTLRIGGTLVIPPESALSPPSPSEWRRISAQHGVTLWNSVPALLGLLCEEASHAATCLPPSLKLIWLSGDVIPEGLPASAQSVSSQRVKIFAMGGATEAGIWSNSADITDHLPTHGLVPYGNALPGQGMHAVRIEDLGTAAVGVPGMLVISGASLMMGYYNDEESSSKALVEVEGKRLYLTQDAGYMRRRFDGSLECMITGRIQGDQGGYVKVRGFRVELQEVETVLRSHHAVKASVVSTFQGELAAYVVLNEGADLTGHASIEEELRVAMAAKLPAYSMPRWIEVLAALPLSSNGKVDRAALPAPKHSNIEDVSSGDDVTTELEVAVLAAAREVGVAVQNRSDDIFAKGADSVAGLRLIFKLEANHGVQIDIGRLFADGRISSMAAALMEGMSTVSRSSDAILSAAILAESSTPAAKFSCPLFLCHGAGTTALALSGLAAELVKNNTYRKVYGVSDSFLSSKSVKFSYSSIEEVASSMADLVVDTIKGQTLPALEPMGLEVALGGWSYGGVVAFACARELEERGIRVRTILMLDAPIGQQEGAELDNKTLQSLAASADDELAEQVAEHFKYCNELLSMYLPSSGRAVAARVLDIRPTNSQVDFLTSRDREALASRWERLTLQDATHFTMVQQPFTQQLANHPSLLEES